jgi:Xaa-Pro dipeptidase
MQYQHQSTKTITNKNNMALQPSTTVTIRAKGADIDKYPAKAHAQRVADKLKLNNGLILLQGADMQYYPDTDMPIPFRQNRAFYYLTGCNEPGCFATYETAKDKLTLWLPKAAEGRRVFYDGRNINAKEAMEKYDVDEVNVIKGPGPKRTNLRKVFVDHYEAGGEFAYFKLPQTLMGKPLRQKMNSRRKTGLRPAIKQCRLIKDEHEIQLIRKANQVSAKAHRNVMNRLHALKSEPEAMAVFMRTCLMNKAKEQAYAPICGAGRMAGQLHYVSNDKNFGNSQLLLVDAGAEWQHYASDVTRTMPINKTKPGHWSSEEAEAVYAAVEKIQEECIKQLAPGKKFIDVAWLAVHMAIDALLEMGILKGDHMEIFHAGTILAFFPHGLGHHMGLDVHDGVPPPADDSKKGKKGKKGDGKKDGQKGELKKNGPKQGPANKAGGKNKENWTVVKKEVLFDAANEKDMSETDGEKEPLLESSNDEKSGPAKKGANKGKDAAEKKDKSKIFSKDKRFHRIQGIYSASFSGNEALLPRMKTQNPTHYSLNPAFCQGPNTPQAPALKEGMVITVEPGLYFNRFILNRQYLNQENHAKFIDQEVLKKFMPVGGVRIEDDILITKDGYENLTTAPKGEEMLKVIRKGAKGSE